MTTNNHRRVLESEAIYFRAMANQNNTPPKERELWQQLADEIDAYLMADNPEEPPALF